MNRLFFRNTWILRGMVILFTIHYSLVTAIAQDDDKVTMFNPVEHAVISQTIAPDARGAGMGDVGVATDPDPVTIVLATIVRCRVHCVISRWVRCLPTTVSVI